MRFAVAVSIAIIGKETFARVSYTCHSVHQSIPDETSSAMAGVAIEPHLPLAEDFRFRRMLRLLLLVVVLKPLSNLLLTWGVRQFPHALSYHPLQYVLALFNPLVIVAVLMQILWLLSRMSLLSLADLSFVLPVTATGYAVSALLGYIFLHEKLYLTQALGISLITGGAVLVAPTFGKLSVLRESNDRPSPLALSHQRVNEHNEE